MRLAVLVTAPLAFACATTDRISLPRTASEQIISTEAIDRSLAQIRWPELVGQRLLVKVGGTQELDRDYLLRSVEILIAERGGIVVDGEDEAQYEVNVVVGAAGIDIEGRFFGVRGSAGSLLIPFTIPELAIYKTMRVDGFAKTEIVLLDPRQGGVVHRSGPTYGTTYSRSRTLFFFFRKRWTDTTRVQRPEPRDEDAY